MVASSSYRPLPNLLPRGPRGGCQCLHFDVTHRRNALHSLLLSVVVAIALVLPSAHSWPEGQSSLRPAGAADMEHIRQSLRLARLRSENLSHEHFLVAAPRTSVGGGEGTDDDEGGGAGRIVGFGQLRPVVASASAMGGGGGGGQDRAALELASLYVDPDHRSLGLGSTLVKGLLEREGLVAAGVSRPPPGGSSGPDAARVVVLMTAAEKASFYTQLGFRLLLSPDEEERSLPGAYLEEVRGAREALWKAFPERDIRVVALVREFGTGVAQRTTDPL